MKSTAARGSAGFADLLCFKTSNFGFGQGAGGVSPHAVELCVAIEPIGPPLPTAAEPGSGSRNRVGDEAVGQRLRDLVGREVEQAFPATPTAGRSGVDMPELADLTLFP
ncbi:hypothetical protein G6045_40290 [Streptomyces sp. YC504]|uniref:Uncharacterized protein n=1 Tax=Streptomyces mesophilus TaxID=1775132 RepID=A0A6G4XXC8_9ACTN|nr:hypothetical protein [Streptomyces mesophilus]NGO81842.1 hypothetical protein [Streptomyces mesophilus]